ncbi:MAG: aminoglycoside phosphotransferase family protein [Bacillota bacterium]|nr:aminoglycoside phosphotransferase family protein [Bacillota bacterium]
MEKGALIGQGRTAEVYEWGEDKVLKLYFDWYKNEWIKYEEESGKALAENGVPCPKVYDIVQEDRRNGIIYERIRGISMLKCIESRPWRTRIYARQMAEVHNRIHGFHMDKLPEQKPHIEYAIRQSEKLLGDKTEKIINYLKELPEGTSVCHGDFHPDNILVRDGSAVVIDWTNAYYGNPLGDTARTLLMFQSTYLPPGTPKILAAASKAVRKSMYSAYLKEYTKLAKVKTEDIKDWILPVAAARLREDVPGEREWLLGLVDSEFLRKGLSM